MINIIQSQHENYGVVFIHSHGAVVKQHLNKLDLPEFEPDKGVIISGAGPDWLIEHVSQKYSRHAFVAIMQPGLLAAVIIYTNSPSYKVGEYVSTEVETEQND